MGPVPPDRVPGLPGDRLVDHSHHGGAAQAQPDPHRVGGQPDDDVVAAVQRVDQPGPFARRIEEPGLLGQDPVVREVALYPAEHELLGCEVEVHLHVPGPALRTHAPRRAEPPAQQAARLLRRGDGDLPLVVEIRPAVGHRSS